VPTSMHRTGRRVVRGAEIDASSELVARMALELRNDRACKSWSRDRTSGWLRPGRDSHLDARDDPGLYRAVVLQELVRLRVVRSSAILGSMTNRKRARRRPTLITAALDDEHVVVGEKCVLAGLFSRPARNR